MGELIDLTGRRFDRLEVLHRAGTKRMKGPRTEPTWLCRCDCDRVVIVLGVNLREGRTRSCGCLRTEVSSNVITAVNNRRWGRNDHDTAATPGQGAG